MEQYEYRRKEDRKWKKSVTTPVTDQDILQSFLIELFLADPRKQSHNGQTSEEKVENGSSR